MNRVAVVGGAGFIGQATCEALRRKGIEPIVLDRATGVDILDTPLRPALGGCDAVIHLAGVLGTHELFDAPDLAIDVNVKGTLRVLQAAEHLGLRYVGISMPPVFPSVYTATKRAAVALASAWHHTYGLPVSHVVAYNAFGAGQKWGHKHPQKIVPHMSVCAWQGLDLPVWGDGEQTVDLIHVSDLGRMLVDALDHGDDAVFDGGTGHAHTVNDVARMILDITGSDSRVRHLPMRRGELPTRIVATGEGWDRLDWRPYFNYEQLVHAVQSYRIAAEVAA